MAGARKAASVKRAFNDDPSWPRALARLLAGESIRSIAATLGTNPRRLRRAFARAGVRVAGANVDRAGVPALSSFRARLGHEPDGRIAKEAGVTPQAVQGERRRLGIAPFKPAPLMRLSAEERSWIVGADVSHSIPRRRRSDEVAPAVVVRKPARESSASAETKSGTPSGSAPRMVLTYRPADPLPPPADGPARRPLLSADWREERRQELERLIRGTQHNRSDRTRIVRAETPMLEPTAPREAAPVRRARTPAWRAADPAALEALAAEAAAEAARVQAATEAARVAEQAARAESARITEERAQAARTAHAELQAAAAQTTVEAHLDTEMSGATAPEAAWATATRPSAPVGPSHADVWPSLPTWAVHAEGLNEIVYVLAADLLGAIAAASAALPQDQFPIVAVEAA